MKTDDNCRYVQLDKIQNLIEHYNRTLNKESEAKLQICFYISNPFKEKRSKITTNEQHFASVIISSNKVLKNRYGKNGIIINESDLKHNAISSLWLLNLFNKHKTYL